MKIIKAANNGWNNAGERINNNAEAKFIQNYGVNPEINLKQKLTYDDY